MMYRGFIIAMACLALRATAVRTDVQTLMKTVDEAMQHSTTSLRFQSMIDGPMLDFFVPNAEQTGMGAATVYMKSSVAIASVAVGGTLTLATAGIAIGTAVLTTYTGILLGKGISALVDKGVSEYYKRKAAKLKEKQLAIFGNWNTCSACLEICMDDPTQCAADLFQNFMGMTLIKMSSMQESDANEYSLSESVQKEKAQLKQFADRVTNSQTPFNFGNALMKCRTDVKWPTPPTNRPANSEEELIPKLHPKCIPEQATVAQQKDAQTALTELVMASFDPSKDLDAQKSKDLDAQKSKGLDAQKDVASDTLKAVVSGEIGEFPIEIQLGEVKDLINGNHTLNPGSEAALTLKLGIAAYINGYGGDPSKMKDVQDAADALSILSVPLGTVLGFLQPVLDVR